MYECYEIIYTQIPTDRTVSRTVAQGKGAIKAEAALSHPFGGQVAPGWEVEEAML